MLNILLSLRLHRSTDRRGGIGEVLPLTTIPGWLRISGIRWVRICGTHRTVIPVDFDPRFALTLNIESARPSVNRFRKGAVVTLAIHSPSELFEEKPRKGKTYNFSLSRTTENGKVRFYALQIE